eukprot:gene67-78_t
MNFPERQNTTSTESLRNVTTESSQINDEKSLLDTNNPANVMNEPIEPSLVDDQSSQIHFILTPGPLLLLYEEVIYLMQHELLNVLSVNNDELSIQDLWTIFCTKNKRFPIKYKAYHYFKEKGFIVKTGINFGMDFTVYRSLPSLCHSELCVLVLDATKPLLLSHAIDKTKAKERDNSNGNDNDNDGSRPEWREIGAITRVMPDVLKTFLQCYVMQTSSSSTSTNTDSSSSAPLIPSTSSKDDSKEIVVNDNIVNDIDCDIKVDKVLLSSSSAAAAVTAITATSVDFSIPDCVSQLCVRVVTTAVRREVTRADLQHNVRDRQLLYRKSSMKENPTTERLVVRKSKKRRDPNEIRIKNEVKKAKRDEDDELLFISIWKKTTSCANMKNVVKNRLIGP